MSTPVGYLVVFPRERRFRPSDLVEQLSGRGAIATWQSWDEDAPDEPHGMLRGDDDVLVGTAELKRNESSRLLEAHSATLSTTDRERVARATAKYLVRSASFEITSLVRMVADVLAEMSDGVALLVMKL